MLFLGLVLFSLSCSKKDKEVSQLLCVIDSTEFKKDHSFIFLIPIIGCSGCKEEILNFITESKSKLPYYGVIVGSMNKAAKIRYNDLLEHPKIYFDSKNCIDSSYTSYFPLLLEINGDKIIKRVELGSENITKELEVIKSQETATHENP